MAFIYCIKNKVTTECLNKDVIKVCQKDPLHYLVNDSLEALKKEINQLVQSEKNITAGNVPLSKMKSEELKQLASSLGIQGYESLTNKELIAVIKEAQSNGN